MLSKLDGYLLHKATKLSHWLQEWTGYTCFAVARAGVLLAMTQNALIVVDHYFPDVLSLLDAYMGRTLMYMLLFLTGLTEISWTHKNEQLLYDGKPLLIHHNAAFMRKVWLVLLATLGPINVIATSKGIISYSPNVFLEHLASEGLGLGSMIFCYFACVVPRPPGRSKIRDLVRKLTTRQVPAMETTS